MARRLVTGHRYEWTPTVKGGSGTIFLIVDQEKEEFPIEFKAGQADQYAILMSMLDGPQPVVVEKKKKRISFVTLSSNVTLAS